MTQLGPQSSSFCEVIEALVVRQRKGDETEVSHRAFSGKTEFLATKCVLRTAWFSVNKGC